MRTLVRFVSAVDLPVPVETAGVCQQLTALLALHCSLPIGSDLARLYAAQRMFLWLELLLARTDRSARGPPGVAEELAPQSGVEVQAPGEIDRGIRQVNQKISGLSLLQTRQPCTRLCRVGRVVGGTQCLAMSLAGVEVGPQYGVSRPVSILPCSLPNFLIFKNWQLLRRGGLASIRLSCYWLLCSSSVRSFDALKLFILNMIVVGLTIKNWKTRDESDPGKYDRWLSPSCSSFFPPLNPRIWRLEAVSIISDNTAEEYYCNSLSIYL